MRECSLSPCGTQKREAFIAHNRPMYPTAVASKVRKTKTKSKSNAVKVKSKSQVRIAERVQPVLKPISADVDFHWTLTFHFSLSVRAAGSGTVPRLIRSGIGELPALGSLRADDTVEGVLSLPRGIRLPLRPRRRQGIDQVNRTGDHIRCRTHGRTRCGDLSFRRPRSCSRVAGSVRLT